ncbi:AAA domain-containing protein [Halocatena halophila]|uniref:AAA domain-containing protein n=1 Tax=Halocatena halophila TaxID=2814576 RepID=UPI002ED42D01
MDLRGPVLDIEPTGGGSSTGDATVTIRATRADRRTATIAMADRWSETAEVLEPGMDLCVTGATQLGAGEWTTSSDSYVIVEPTYVVTVTDIREWVQCPRQYYLSKFTNASLSYPLIKGSLVHEVFGDLLRGRELEASIDDRVEEAGLELGLLGRDRESVLADVRDHAQAIEGWLNQGTLGDTDEWRSEQTLLSDTFGIRGRADAVRRGGPVELKTGKNTKREPRFEDKIQAACYALLLGERNETPPDTGTLLYTKNAALDRAETPGDLSPAKEFSIGSGLLRYVVRARNELVATECAGTVPTGYEADAICEYCFEQDTCMVVAGRLDQESKAGAIGSALPAAERRYFDVLCQAIETERRAVHRAYARLWKEPATERAANDEALIDLEPAGTTQQPDGTWNCRATGQSAISKIRPGDVVLASDGHPTRGDAELARVLSLSDDGTHTTVAINTDEPIELRRLDVYPSDYGLNRLLSGVHDAILKGEPARRDLLFDRREPAFEPVETTFIDSNEQQNTAVQMAVGANDCALVHGPPGTGKTYTLAHIVQALLERDQRVLLSAFTNRAVDNALEQLRELGCTDFVRIGTEHGVSESMQDARLDPRGDPDDRVEQLESAPIVAATTATCGSSPVLSECSFDVAIVDEASQLTEPGTLCAINQADRFVLVGDHQQLPPVVRADFDDDDPIDLSRSLFERLFEAFPDAAITLTRQYRMSQRIQWFASEEFYDGALRPATPAVASQQLDDLPGVSEQSLPDHLDDGVVFVDPDGKTSGNVNRTEAERIGTLIEAYRAAGVPAEDIGVIAPFRAQVGAISQLVADAITVDTVDRFQGSSKAVIIVSFVATDELESPIFEDRRRINVALTRAKKTLCLVGDETALRSDPFYERMLEWAQRS